MGVIKTRGYRVMIKTRGYRVMIKTRGYRVMIKTRGYRVMIKKIRMLYILNIGQAYAGQRLDPFKEEERHG